MGKPLKYVIQDKGTPLPTYTPPDNRFTPETVITGIAEYPNGTIIVQRELVYKPKTERLPNSQRGKIMNFSNASKARLAWIVAETNIKFRSFLTLTLPEESWNYVNGKRFKSAQNIFNQSLRRRNISYLWFLEFTQRETPHLHYFLTSSPDKITHRNKLLPVAVARRSLATSWLNSITSKTAMGDEWITDGVRDKFYTVHAKKHTSNGKQRYAWENIKKNDGAKRYALKYGLKSYQKTLPDVYDGFGRWYGYTRDIKRSVGEPRLIKITEDELQEKLSFLQAIGFVPKIIFPRNSNGKIADTGDKNTTSIPNHQNHR